MLGTNLQPIKLYYHIQFYIHLLYLLMHQGYNCKTYSQFTKFFRHIDKFSHYSRVVSYGSLGTVVGHEVMHAFDPKGIEHDYMGREFSWLSPKAAKVYNQTTQCISKFFSRFAEDNTTVIFLKLF